ncbi:hypothetical protein ACNOYE_24865 [Nannocystaceae bacterium ST9]
MSASQFRELVTLDVDQVVELACSAAGELVAINDLEGRVRLLATTPEPRWLPLEFVRGEVEAVLLHPDGQRVVALEGGAHPRVRIHDPWTGALLRSLDPGLGFDAEDDEDGSDDDAEPELDALRRLRASILDRRPLLTWLLAAEIANNREDGRVPWLPEILEQRGDQLIWPDRVTRLALHPDRRRLAVLDRGCFVIDLDASDQSDLVVSTLDRQLELAGLIEYGEGTHTLAIDDRGALAIASTAVSGNPFLAVDRFDAATGEPLSTTETWRQVWTLGGTSHEVHVYDPTTFLPPDRIPPGEHLVVFRRRHVEVWSRAGLLRTHALQPRSCVIPGFDPGNFCRLAPAFVIDDEGFALLDLITGERTPCRPRGSEGELLRATDLRWIEFVPGHAVLALWTDHELLATARGGDRWSRCALPEGASARMRVLGEAVDPLVALVLDEDGVVWQGRLDLDHEPAMPPRRSLAELEAELIADPDAIEPFAVYADALTERGDPRGELILLHLQADDAQADALIRRHASTLLPGLRTLAADSYSLEWRRGFVRSARFRVEGRDALAEVLCLLGSDSARLIESLTIELADTIEAGHRASLQAGLDAYLAAAARWPRLT